MGFLPVRRLIHSFCGKPVGQIVKSRNRRARDRIAHACSRAIRIGTATLFDGDLPRLPDARRRARAAVHPLELPAAEEDHAFQDLAPEQPELATAQM